MPELPEAETIARGLREPLTGASVDRVAVIHADVLDLEAEDFAGRLRGSRFEAIGRRGKNLVLRLADSRRLVVNLGMSGRLLMRGPGAGGPPPTHPAVYFHLQGGLGSLVYHDVRRFGRLSLHSAKEYAAWSATLGPEPLGPEFTAVALERGLRSSATPLRSWLLDQRRVAGVGNIYANEAAFLARIDPRARTNSLDADAARRLHRAIRRVLSEAIDARGTTLRDYRTAQGWEGEYGAKLQVYGRAGEPCPRCAEPIVREVLSNRSVFFCPRCQPAP
ncbi:MAG: bifunctional DNA-formamidopyrimidine glycosylase/DNA-(apurinic or apyrimidinic site) lyase [Gemmatimonadales bacterium]|nr:MAG: bifunctional DNA-formamidopyrimidine glycosylase/DNA-(apurinic or apyrimidinic site) lyase [Gemmatimonadales bacterium]